MPRTATEHNRIAKISRTMAQHGYRVWHGYANRTPKGGLSSGVAILYKAHLAAGAGMDLIPHRAAGIVLHTGSLGKVLIVSAYLDVAGDDAEKGSQIAGIVQAAQQADIEHVWIGGDFNTTPDILEANMPIAVRGQVVCTGGPTCRTRGKYNTWTKTQLDYFWMSHKDRLLVTSCQLETRGHTAPHTGVRVHIRMHSNQAVDVLERPRREQGPCTGSLARMAMP
jgi:endonuclease/exonuclease/phosphatase family metal-dependent hydrolase